MKIKQIDNHESQQLVIEITMEGLYDMELWYEILGRLSGDEGNETYQMYSIIFDTLGYIGSDDE